MVDIDKLKDKRKKKGGDSDNSQKEKQSKSKPSSGGSGSSPSGSVGSDSGTFSLDDDQMMDPEGKQMGRVAKEWAEEGGDFNYDSGASGSFSQYASRQVNEVQELHDNVYEMATDNMENFDEFTLYFHALFFNLAQNRVGIAETIQKQFDMSKQESVQKADQICKRAGEEEMVRKILHDMTANLSDL